MKDELHGKQYFGTASQVFRQMRVDGMTFLIKNAMSMRATFKWDVLTIMMTHPQKGEDWNDYILSKSD